MRTGDAFEERCEQVRVEQESKISRKINLTSLHIRDKRATTDDQSSDAH
jgi:hypothetical protein